MESWLKLYVEFAFDPKVQSMSEANQRRLAMIFCLTKAEMLPGLSDDELAKGLSISKKELASTKTLFIAKRFIEDDWSLRNWGKRQRGLSDSLERTQRYRDRQRNATVTSQERHSDATVTSHVSHADALARPDQRREEDKTPIIPRRGKPSATADDCPLPIWLPKDDLDAWLQHRKAIGHPVKPASLPAVINKLKRFKESGEDPLVILEASIVGGYQGLFAPPANGKHPGKKRSIVDDTGKLGPMDITPEMRREIWEKVRAAEQQSIREGQARKERERLRTTQQNTDE